MTGVYPPANNARVVLEAGFLLLTNPVISPNVVVFPFDAIIPNSITDDVASTAPVL